MLEHYLIKVKIHVDEEVDEEKYPHNLKSHETQVKNQHDNLKDKIFYPQQQLIQNHNPETAQMQSEI